MSYQLLWSNLALESLEKLPFDISERILKKLEQVKENPKHFIEGLSGLDFKKVRVGDYRVLVDNLESQKIIAIRDLGHRKNIYKKYKTS